MKLFKAQRPERGKSFPKNKQKYLTEHKQIKSREYTKELIQHHQVEFMPRINLG